LTLSNMVNQFLKYFSTVKDDKIFIDINDEVKFSMEDFNSLMKSDRHIRTLKKRGREGNSILSSFAIRDTITAEVYCQPLYWATIAIYLIARYIPYGYITIENPKIIPLPFSIVTVLGSWVAFLLTFFVSQSYSRYLQQYDICSQVIMSIVATVALSQRAVPEKYAWKYFRYVNALHVLAYAGLSKKLNLANFFIPMNRTWKLLSPKEEKRVVAIAASSDMGCEKEVLVWTLNYIKQLNDKKILDTDTMKLLTADINSLGLRLGTLYSHSKQPMAFGYVQILLVLSGVYLPLLAFDLGQQVFLRAPQWIATLVGLITVMIAATLVIGLRLLAMRLQVPFEGVPDSFPVIHFTHLALESSARLLMATPLEEHDDEIEAELMKGRPKLGVCYDVQ